MKNSIWFFVLLFVVNSCTTRTMQSVASEPRIPKPIPIAPNPIKQSGYPTLLAWFPITSDPRVPGLWYYTLMITTEEHATKLATFCRARGLETYVTQHRKASPRLYEVFALPGFTEPYDATMEKIICSIDQKWQGAAPWVSSGSDLRNAFPKLEYR